MYGVSCVLFMGVHHRVERLQLLLWLQLCHQPPVRTRGPSGGVRGGGTVIRLCFRRAATMALGHKSIFCCVFWGHLHDKKNTCYFNGCFFMSQSKFPLWRGKSRHRFAVTDGGGCSEQHQSIWENPSLPAPPALPPRGELGHDGKRNKFPALGGGDHEVVGRVFRTTPKYLGKSPPSRLAPYSPQGENYSAIYNYFDTTTIAVRRTVSPNI